MISKTIYLKPEKEIKNYKKGTQILTNKTFSQTNKNKKYLFLIAAIFMAFNNLLFGQSKFKVIKAGRLIDGITGTVLPNQTILIDNTKIFEIPLKSKL